MSDPSFLTRLSLTDFRSYRALDAAFDGRPVIFYGENGAGKTNILEAVSLLSPGRGLRRAKLPDFANRRNDETAPLWGLAATLSTEVKAGTGQIPGAPGRRQIRIDGAAASGTDLAKLITLNWLTPAQDRLFAGGAADRRKFFDRLCLSKDPSHGRAVLAYEKARAERNRLLSDGVNDRAWYEALEHDLAKWGSQIAQTRHLVLARLQSEIDDKAQSVFPKAALALEGETETLIAHGQSLEETARALTEILASDRPQDLRAGRTLRGVHKSDLIVTHRAKSMPAANCSTGEQKALLINIILAQASAQTKSRASQDNASAEAARPPKTHILLLDEVAAHLDDHRRAALAEDLIALDAHVFMTGTDAHLFSAFGDRAQRFEVSNGKLRAP